MTLALVFAMSGGAYAAKHYLITSTKQISPKVLHALKGKPGPAGKDGAPGPTGPQGAGGPQGPAGPAGPTGPTGPQGVKGENGTEGKEGKEGQPWTAGGVLPKGSTETGQWADGEEDHKTGQVFFVPVSFPIPLTKELEATNVHFVAAGTPQENDPEGCKGTVEKPGASPGNLCVFAAVVTENVTGPNFINFQGTGEENAGPTGTIMEFKVSALQEGPALAGGTWAVTD